MGRLSDKLLRAIGFKELIRIPGKSNYDQLTKAEVAMMIDAFLGDGNEFFDPLAFNDFLHVELKNDDLKQIQEDINSKAFWPAKGDEWPAVNRNYLLQIMSELMRED